MKWLFRIFMLIVLVILTNTAFAQSEGWNYWRWWVGAGVDDYYSVYDRFSEFGVLPFVTDNYDGEELIRTEGITSAMYAATYHINSNSNDGWSGPTGLYRVDFYSPVALQPGQSKSWLIYVWATPGVPDTFYTMHTYCFMIMPEFMPSDEYSFTYKLVAKPDGITGGPAVGTTWEMLLPSGVSFDLPIYLTDNGLSGYQFQLTATAVPEPSTFVALPCVLLGVLAHVRKRRNI